MTWWWWWDGEGGEGGEGTGDVWGGGVLFNWVLRSWREGRRGVSLRVRGMR